ncbi:hypothetical protein LCGC14_1219870 [marine sediment metagenome]|uniref:Acetyltransferase n=1 Tax=marine sediment metagenome TaxID=412755 RepID=A0A0F9LBN3_9ZZZZ
MVYGCFKKGKMKMNRVKKLIYYLERVFNLRRIALHIVRLANDPFFRFSKIDKSKSNLKIGKNTFISYLAYLDITAPIVIGNNCIVSAGVKIFTHSHSLFNKREFSLNDYNPDLKNPIIIENNTVIYTGAQIMSDVEIIHKSCMILSGAILNKSTTGPYEVWGGIPAKLIRIKEEDKNNS